MSRYTVLHLFAGLGGGAVGFKRAGFRSVGAFDYNAGACADFAQLTGEPCTQADLWTMTPKELRDACTGAPDVVFSSPPCQGNSRSLSGKVAKRRKYLLLNEVAHHAIRLVLQAWPDRPPRLIVFENVPGIVSRSRSILDEITWTLGQHGYATRESFHCCGQLGGLAQKRKRFLYVARHIESCPDFLREPPEQPLKSIGEVVGELGPPVFLPKHQAKESLHYCPRMKGINWIRLALIPPGKDWKALPPSVALKKSTTRHNGPLGVERWDDAAHTVQGSGGARGSWGSIADPRVEGLRPKKNPRGGAYGVRGYEASANTVVASACHDNSSTSIADPRLVDPRSTCSRRPRSLGVTGYDEPLPTCVIGQGTAHNGPWQVADPRLTYKERNGGHRVVPWPEASHCVIGESSPDKGFNLADPRIPEIVGDPLDPGKRDIYAVIKALDGTWHRPMTTAELALLQGLPIVKSDGSLVELHGTKHGDWRKRIGNAVPPQSAEAIARECWATLEASDGGGWRLSSQGIWVQRRADEVRETSIQQPRIQQPRRGLTSPPHREGLMSKTEKSTKTGIAALKERVKDQAELRELSGGHDLACPTGDPGHLAANIEFYQEEGEVPTFCWGEGDRDGLCKKPLGQTWEELSLLGGKLRRGHNRLGYNEAQFDYEDRCAARLLIDEGTLTYDAAVGHLVAETLHERYGTQIDLLKARYPEWRRVLKRQKQARRRVSTTSRVALSEQLSGRHGGGGSTIVVNGGSLTGVAIGAGASASVGAVEQRGGAQDLVGRGYDLNTANGRLDAMCNMFGALFCQVPFLIGMPSAILPNSSQAQQAVAVAEWAQANGRVEELKATIRKMYRR